MQNGTRNRSNSLPALANDDGVAIIDAEARGHVRRDVAVPLLIPARMCKSLIHALVFVSRQ